MSVALLVVVPAGAESRVVYDEPVDAPIADPFRAPPTPYAAGNRGIEYATPPGSQVRAAGAGIVQFAGRVGGHLHVTLAHADGIRTSYSYLADVLVRRGARVERGQVLGVTGRVLHVGARRGAAYVDPASLWGPPRVTVRLVELVPW